MNAKPMKESLATALYDLARAERFVPFHILFASGQRYDIKTREHIWFGRSTGSRRWSSGTTLANSEAFTCPAVIKVERGEPESSPDIALNLTIELASVRSSYSTPRWDVGQ
jgi:hypothetical protein